MNTPFYRQASGRVGLGTSSPNNLLHIKNGDLMIENDAATGGTGIARDAESKRKAEQQPKPETR